MHFFFERQDFRKKLSLLLVVVLVALPVLSSHALAGGLIRDAETEKLIRDYARPIFKAAGLSGQNVKIHIIGSGSFNAFVIDGQNMFIHTGAIVNSKAPNQLIGVIAHETGHITGGHLASLRSQLKKAQTASLMFQILSIAAMIGGAATGNQFGQAGGAAMQGGNLMLQKQMLADRRIKESSADRAAVSFLNATHQSAKGMLQTFEYFMDQSRGSMRQVNPYLQSHPLPPQRIEQLRDLAARSPYFRKLDPAALQFRHDMVKAKLIAFLDKPRTVLNIYGRRNTSLPARYAQAIAYYKQSGLKAFLPRINALIKDRPGDPFLHEIKGQFLFEGGRPSTAIKPLRKAVSLAPREPLIRILLAQALLSSGDDLFVSEAIRHLRKALGREKHNAAAYRQLAQAYGRKRKIAQAELASAQAYFYEGKLNLAKQQAKRAKKKIKQGSAGWLIADDILKFQRPQR